MDALLIPLTVVLGLLGLVLGSFLNVVVYRVPRHESVLFPASHCPRCGNPVAARHNVPVLGWLVLRGRCASCAEPISARYPLVEACTGAAFVVVTLLVGVSLWLPLALALVTVAIPLALIGYDARRAAHVTSAPADGNGARSLSP